MGWQWHQMHWCTICKALFAPRSGQITTAAPHHSSFYRPDPPPDAQPTLSKHWKTTKCRENRLFLTVIWENKEWRTVNRRLQSFALLSAILTCFYAEHYDEVARRSEWWWKWWRQMRRPQTRLQWLRRSDQRSSASLQPAPVHLLLTTARLVRGLLLWVIRYTINGTKTKIPGPILKLPISFCAFLLYVFENCWEWGIFLRFS